MLDQNGILQIIERIKSHRHGADVFGCPATDCCTVAFQLFIVQIQVVEEFCQIHIAGAFPAVLIQLLPVVYNVVVFIPDFAYQLFQHIFHSDNTHDAAIFVSHDNHMGLMAAEFIHDVMEFHGFGDVNRFQQQVRQLNILVVHQFFQQMFDVQNAHHMVNGAFIHRISGKLGFGDGVQDEVHAVMEFKTDNIDTGGQDICCVQIGEFQSGLQQFRFAFVDDTLVFRGVQQVFQFLFRDGNSLGILLPQDAEQIHDSGGDPHNREEQDHQNQQRPCGDFGDCFAATPGHHLGSDFADDQNQYGHNQGDNGGCGLVSNSAVHPDSQIDCQHRSHGGGADVNQVITHQNGGQSIIVMVVNEAHQFLGCGRILGIPLHFQLAQRSVGNFRTGEEGRTQQEEEYQKISHSLTLLTSDAGLRLYRTRPEYRQPALPADLPW